MAAKQEFDFEFVKLLVQYAELEKRVKPLVGPASQKIVRDLIDTGCTREKLASIADRSPTYIQAVYNGKKTLDTQTLVALIKYAIRAGGQNASSK